MLYLSDIIIVMSKWAINLNKLKSQELPAPFGYSRDHSLENKNKSSSEHKTLLEKVSVPNMQKLMDIASANKMQIVMSLFMMWMLGNAINIFPIFLVFKGFSLALTAIIDVNKGTSLYNTVFKDY
jgi:hypothetical protein